MSDSPTGSDVSRRSLVKTAATAAAAGGALVLAGPAATAAADTAGRSEQAHPGRDAEPDHRDGDAHVMVRVIDERLGTLEVFTATGHRFVTDRALARQLVRLGR
jgi:hypothetical protein